MKQAMESKEKPAHVPGGPVGRPMNIPGGPVGRPKSNPRGPVQGGPKIKSNPGGPVQGAGGPMSKKPRRHVPTGRPRGRPKKL